MRICRKTIPYLGFLFFALNFCQIHSQADERLRIAVEIEQSFTRFLECWYPRAVDNECGGFLSTFNADWKPVGPQNKSVVNQARHVWTTSQAAVFFPKNPEYHKAAEQGFRFLKEKMWDSRCGGFFQLLNRKGEIDPALEYGDEKRAYGNAFGIYACTAFYTLTGDTAALRLAQNAFLWLDAHARDSVRLGYFQNLKRDGTPVDPRDPHAKGWDRNTAYMKDFNSSIHLLEAFTALYSIWPDTLVRKRLNEMFHLIRDVITCPNGYMRLYFSPDWKPVSTRDSSDAVRRANFELDHVTFGHDVETAYLLIEASQTLGIPYDTTTFRTARRMVDHSLRAGWDKKSGGLFSMGTYLPGSDTITIINDSKDWWSQAEALHTFLLMSRLFPDDPTYFDYFRKEWDYMKRYLIDSKRGGWYWAGIDNHPEGKNDDKGSEWKATYHETRSLLNCLRLLRSDPPKSNRNLKRN